MFMEHPSGLEIVLAPLAEIIFPAIFRAIVPLGGGIRPMNGRNMVSMHHIEVLKYFHQLWSPVHP